MFSLICAWTESWANNGDAGDLRRHRAHYDVIVKGIENQLECPPMEDKKAKPTIPANLSEALLVLENDVVIKDSLGEDLVSAFIDTKKEFELRRFANHDVKSNSQNEISAEVLLCERLM